MAIDYGEFEPSDFGSVDDYVSYTRNALEDEHPELRAQREEAEQRDLERMQDPTQWELAGAAVVQQSTPYMVTEALRANKQLYNVFPSLTPPELRDEEYDGLLDMPPDLADFYEDFEQSPNRGYTLNLIAKVRAERMRRDTLARGGAAGWGWEMAAAAADPVGLLLPWMWEAKFGLLAGRSMRGGRLARGVRTAGAVTAVEAPAVALTEAIAQSAQYERTFQESMLAIGGTALLTNTVGFGVGFIKTPRQQQIARYIMEDLSRDTGKVAGDQVASRVRTVEMAARDPDFINEMAPVIIGTKTLGDRKKITSMMTPLMSLQESPVAAVREIADELVQHRLMKMGNLEGKASPLSAETEIQRLQQGLFMEGHAHYIAAFREQAEQGYGLTRAEFDTLVSNAMHRGDKSDIPAVAKAARAWRDVAIDPLTQRAQRVGLLSEELRLMGADSYFPRHYPIKKIRSNPKFHAMIARHFGRFEGVTLEQTNEMAAELIRGLRYTPSGRLDLEIGGSSRFAGRQLNIPHEELRPFLDDNVENVMKKFLFTYAPDVVLAERFGMQVGKAVLPTAKGATGPPQVAIGAGESSPAFNRVRAGYQALIDAHPERVARYEARMATDIENIGVMVKRLRGLDNLPADLTAQTFNRASRAYRALTGMAYLGGQTLAAISDMAFATLQQGFGPVLKAMATRILATPTFRSIAKQDLVGIGVGADNVLNARSFALTYEDAAAATQWVEKGTSAFSFASLMAPWNAAWKSMVGTAAQTKIITAGQRLVEGKSIARVFSKALRTQLATMGLDEDMLKRIATQAHQHGYESPFGGWIANTADWTDARAAHTLELVTLRETETSIVTPGVGDRPKITSSEVGKWALQFQSFLVGAHDQMLVPTLQRVRNMPVADARVWASVGLMIVLGAVSRESKKLVKGQEPTDFNDPDFSWPDYMKDTIDASGITAIWSSIFDMADMLADNRVTDAVAVTPSWKTRGAPTIEKLVPAAGLAYRQVEQGINLPEQLIEGEYADAALDTWRVLPFQNLFYGQWLFQLEEDQAKVGE